MHGQDQKICLMDGYSRIFYGFSCNMTCIKSSSLTLPIPLPRSFKASTGKHRAPQNAGPRPRPNPISRMEDPGEFQDWEMVSSGDDDSIVVLGTADDIRSDYFEKARPSPSEEDEEGGIDSDNPSSKDADSDSRIPASVRREDDFNSDDEIKMIGVVDEGDSGSGDGDVGQNSRFAGFGGSHGVDEMEHDAVREFSSGEKEEMEGEGEARDGLGIGGSGRDEGRRGVVFWKMPVQVLKLCLVKLKTVWLIPVAAAIMGFVIVGRRLHRLRHKRPSFSRRVAVDDKKASDFMAQATRLNEALLPVKRLPVTRAFSGTGLPQWPVVLLK